MVSHDAPTVSARFIYGSTTTHDGSATIHHGGATNAYNTYTIRYGASTIQAGSVTTSNECARISGCYVTVCQIMTPNVIISSTFDEVSHAVKKKSCGKIKTVTGPTGWAQRRTERINRLMLNIYLSASGCLLSTFANSLDLNLARQNKSLTWIYLTSSSFKLAI